MTLHTTGRGFKAFAVSLAVALGLTACSRDYTVAYLYVTSATRTNAGVVNAYAVDFQSGALQQLADSPIPSGGSNPVALVATRNANYVYVVNHDTSTVVQFNVGTDGKLYAQNTYNVVQGSSGANGTLIGSFPTAAAIDAANKFLYVTFTFQNGFTTARPGPGGIAIFPINADGTLGTPVSNTTVGTTAANPLPYVPVGRSPVGVVASPYGNDVYVVEQDLTASTTNPSATGTVVGFSEATNGSLSLIAGNTAITGTTLTGFKAGVRPSAIAEDPSGHYVYVTDQATNQLYSFAVVTGGALLATVSSPYSTGQFPLGITVDPRGLFVYVANYGDSTISTYAINQATGALSAAGFGGGQVSTGPTCVTIEPALGKYLFTSNNIDGTVSGQQLDSHTGALSGIQGTPYAAQPLPTCALAVSIGNHATQLVTP